MEMFCVCWASTNLLSGQKHRRLDNLNPALTQLVFFAGSFWPHEVKVESAEATRSEEMIS